jgi:hypothetical protein
MNVFYSVRQGAILLYPDIADTYTRTYTTPATPTIDWQSRVLKILDRHIKSSSRQSRWEMQSEPIDMKKPWDRVDLQTDKAERQDAWKKTQMIDRLEY